jgi:hypothetical protein
MGRIGRGAFVVGVVLGTGVVALLLSTYALLRLAPNTVLSSCSYRPPAPSCSPPVNPWGLGLQTAATVIGMATVGTLFVLRHRGVLGRIPPPPNST